MLDCTQSRESVTLPCTGSNSHQVATRKPDSQSVVDALEHPFLDGVTPCFVRTPPSFGPPMERDRTRCNSSESRRFRRLQDPLCLQQLRLRTMTHAVSVRPDSSCSLSRAQQGKRELTIGASIISTVPSCPVRPYAPAPESRAPRSYCSKMARARAISARHKTRRQSDFPSFLGD